LHFHNLISFSCFGFVAVVPGNPETQTVSRSFPKLSAALQKNFGTDAAYRTSRRKVFRLTSRERTSATPLAESGSEQVSVGVTHRTCTKLGAMRRSCDVTS
jgi:hypothetical protein